MSAADDEICHCPACRVGHAAPHDFHLEARPMSGKVIEGATLAFFADLRGVILDESQAPRNRLQTLDIRISDVSGARPPAAAVAARQQARRDLALRPLTELLQETAQELLRLAEVCGVVLTIEQRPLFPPAMGHYESVAHVRPARGVQHPSAAWCAVSTVELRDRMGFPAPATLGKDASC